MEDKSQKRQAFRQILLDQLARNELDADEIRQIIASTAGIPKFFDDYLVNEFLDAIKEDDLDWSVGYFDRQRKQAQSNFSEKRIAHLIDVREHLIKNGIVGFAKIAAVVPSEGTNTMNMQDYIPGANLVKMAEQGTTSQVRSALINELEDNRLEDNEIVRAVAWTLVRVPDLFVDYEEHSLAREMINDPVQWDVDYYDSQTSYLNTNFAKARFEHLIAVRNALRKRGVKGFERIIISKSKPQPQQQSQASSRPYVDTKSSQPEFLRVALMAGGALAVLAALVISLL